MWIRTAAVLLSISAAFAADSPVMVAHKALDLLLANKDSEFSQLLSDAAKERLTMQFLRERVHSEIEGFGTFEQIEQPVTAKSGTDTLVSFPVRFSKTRIAVQFTINPSGQVAGLYFRPGETSLPPEWKRPSYSDPSKFREREITVGEGEWQVPGTLTVPNGKGPFPGVVMVPGPGPNDRDETLYSNHIFKDMAEGLASRGIAVLRYDKRSKTHGLRMSQTPYTLKEDTTDDSLKAIALLRKQPEINAKRVFVVAHSLGGYAMPRIALQDGKLAGAVILAGNARPIEDVVLDQNIYMLELRGEGTKDDRDRLEALKAEVRKVKALGTYKNNSPVVLGLPYEYLYDLKNYDPVAEAKKLTIPLLFLQGQRDMQVTMKDFNRWRNGLSGMKNVTFETYPSLNHLFITGTGPANPAELRQAGNIAAEVITDIVKFVGQLRMS